MEFRLCDPKFGILHHRLSLALVIFVLGLLQYYKRYVNSLFHVLLMFKWVWMKERTIGIVFASMYLVLA